MSLIGDEIKVRCKVGAGWNQCHNRANGEDGLCGVHRAASRRRAERHARWAREAQQDRINQAQADFVTQWRDGNPDDAFNQTHICPLCGEAIQVKVAQAAEYAALGAGDLFRDEIAAHERWHGPDWTAYTSFQAPGAGGEDGREG